jgi:RHS repeat-associated protein
MKSKNKNYFMISVFRFTTLVLLGVFAIGTAYAQKAAYTSIKCPGEFSVNSFTGFVQQRRVDLTIPNRNLPFEFSFSYNSNKFNRNIGYGRGWTFRYSIKYRNTPEGIRILWGGGREDLYIPEGSGYKSPAGVFDKLIPINATTFKIVQPDGKTYFFENAEHKRVTKISDRNNNELQMTYTDSLLTAIADGNGRSIALSYTAGRLTEIKDELDTPTRTITYAYDQVGNLTSVTDPAGNVRSYAYFPNGPINSYTDRNGNVVNIIYNANRTIKEIISCVARKSFSYNKNNRSTFVIDYRDDGVKIISTYRHDQNGNLVAMEGSCCGYQKTFEYDDNNRMRKLTDANGNVSEYTWDDQGNLLSITDPLGNTSTYTYEPNFNLLASYTDRNGNQTSYSYDANGNVTSASFPEGITNAYTYNSNGDMISVTDGRGNTTNYSYDNFGQPILIAKPLNSTIQGTFNPRGKLISYTDGNNNTSSFQFDLLDRLTVATDPDGNPFLFDYDANGNLVGFTDRNNHTTQLQYDAMDRLVKGTNPLGAVITFGYDSENNVVFIKDRNNHVRNYKYDNLNRLISRTNGMDEIVEMAYDGAGNMVSLTELNGNQFSITYDKLNRVVGINDQIGAVGTFAYDNVGNRIAEVRADGSSHSFSYDGINRIIALTDPLGNTESYAYDESFNLTSITDRLGASMNYTYDALNRRISNTDRNGYQITYSYDQNGNLAAITDQKGNITAYGYDAQNRIISTTFPDGSLQTVGYDNEGNAVQYVDRNGTAFSLSYNPLNQLLSRTGNGETFSYAYDPEGQLIEAQNQHSTVTLQYDAANRLIAETLNGKTTQYLYDMASGRITDIYPGGRIIEHNYDPRYRTSAIAENGSIIAGFVYDDLNRTISRDYPSLGKSMSLVYNEIGSLTGMTLLPDAEINMLTNFDENGNKLFENKIHKPEQSEQFGYDTGMRLTSFQKGIPQGNSIPAPISSFSFIYDQIGNRVSSEENGNTRNYISNLINQYTQISGVDGFNPTYDLNSNLINDGFNIYQYNTDNQLIAVNGAVTAQYKYDALGRRIERVANGTTLKYYFAANHEVEIRNENDVVVETRVYRDGIDDIVSARKNGVDYFYHKNYLSSVIALSGADGNIVERYEYDAFGKVSYFDADYNPLPSSLVGNEILFTGRNLDQESGKYYYRARHYNPELGRFNQNDPLGYASGDLNLYTYVLNMPTRYNDPFGAECHSPQGGGGGGGGGPSELATANAGTAAAGELASAQAAREAANAAQQAGFNEAINRAANDNYMKGYSNDPPGRLSTKPAKAPTSGVGKALGAAGAGLAVYSANEAAKNAAENPTTGNVVDAGIGLASAGIGLAALAGAVVGGVFAAPVVAVAAGVAAVYGLADLGVQLATNQSIAQNLFDDPPCR